MGLLRKIKGKLTHPMYLSREKELDEYETFIEAHFGAYEKVFHEIVSPDIHLDIVIIPPTEDQPYYQLITMGMGAYCMNTPKSCKEYEWERAELVMHLPADWKLESQQEEDYWPIRYLKISARLPLQSNSWIGYGHTVSKDEHNSSFASNTELCSIMLTKAHDRFDREVELRLQNKKKINFYQCIPLYREELAYKDVHGADALLELFQGEVSSILQIDRKNYGL